jgi:hypothetical protein
MADDSRNSDRLHAAGWEKFDLDLRPHRQIRHDKQAHADIAQIDAKSVDVGRVGEYLHGSVEQLAFSPSSVWLETEFENHPSTGEEKVALGSRPGKDYGRSLGRPIDV